MPGVSKLELNAGQDRKTDTRSHGGGRGGPVENGLYANIKCLCTFSGSVS